MYLKLFPALNYSLPRKKFGVLSDVLIKCHVWEHTPLKSIYFSAQSVCSSIYETLNSSNNYLKKAVKEKYGHRNKLNTVWYRNEFSAMKKNLLLLVSIIKLSSKKSHGFKQKFNVLKSNYKKSMKEAKIK